ncbi:hypothetical protein [Modestobacter sp. URMC 112]
MAIAPRGVDLKRCPHEDPGGPVVMLNLLRFAEGGHESYDQSAKALPETFLLRYGGAVLYAGDGGTPLVAEQGQDCVAPAATTQHRRADVRPGGRTEGEPWGRWDGCAGLASLVSTSLVRPPRRRA